MQDDPSSSQTGPGPAPASTARWPVHKKFRLAAALILFAGFSAAGLIYALEDNAPDGAAEFQASHGRGYDFSIERVGGKMAVYAAHFSQWLGGLWHGRPLAITVAVLASALALLTYWIADLLDEPDVLPGAAAADPASRRDDQR